MNKFKRWYYELTEKQVERITVAVATIFVIFDFISFFTTYAHGALPKDNELAYYILSLLLIPILAALLVYYLLWMILPKQIYLERKEYEELCTKVRNRFKLNSEFKEIIFYPSNEMYNPVNYAKMIQDAKITFFAKEQDGKILLGIRNDTDKQPTFFPIEDYNFFDKNFKPKE